MARKGKPWPPAPYPQHPSHSRACGRRWQRGSYDRFQRIPPLFPFQHKQRMADRRTLKLLKGRVRGDAIGANEGVAVLDFFSQNEAASPLGSSLALTVSERRLRVRV